MKKKIVFYQNWSREAENIHKEKHAINLMLKDGREDQYLFAVDIRENNQYFLELLENKLIEGYEACDLWLRGLLSSYVKSCEHEMGIQFNDKYRYHEDWLKNTLFIINDKHPKITEWCNKYLQFLHKIETENEPKKTPLSDYAKADTGNLKNFADYLPNDKKDVLMKKIHELLDNNASGRDVAKVLEVLDDKKYIPKHSRIINCAIREFDLKCSNQSISKYFRNGMFKEDEKQRIIDKLP